MDDQGYLNKTILVLLSDHGIRYGDFRETNQGMIEERQSLLYIILPKWFKQTYPKAHENLIVNRHRLTTPFDIHATLKDLLNVNVLSTSNIKKRSKLRLKRSTSLFIQVPPTRTCDTAGIANHWCTCFERNEISSTDDRSQNAATFVVQYINDLLKNFTKCKTLALKSILFVNIEASSANFNLGIERNSTLYDLIIGIITEPNMAKFEATVRFPADNSGNLSIVGTISRINKYGNQSYCINDLKLKLFCFCD